jgi:sulfite exporter TauE/SafE
MTAMLIAVFVASLVGSLHCAGMCGGIVTLCVGGRPVAGRRAWGPPALYNFGRVLTYASLGAVSGAIGAAFDLGGAAVGWTRAATVVAGAAMIIIGGAALVRTLGWNVWTPTLPPRLHGLFQRGLARVRRLPAGLQPLLVGVLTGFLPCGWLYAFVLSAAGTGSAGLGALTMVVFWAGTLPVMLALGVGLQAVTAPLRRHVPRLTALALVVVGAVTIFGRLSVPAYAGIAAPAGTTPAAIVEHVESLDAEAMPCCNDDAGQ